MRFHGIFSLLIGFGLAFAVSVSANAQDTTACDGLKGAAFGLCKAATAVGCSGSPDDTAGCALIAQQFEEITGTTPPWTVPCPCGSAASFITHIETHYGGSADLSCSVKLVSPGSSSEALTIDVAGQNNTVFTFLPPLEAGGKNTCGLDSNSIAVLADDAEAQSCANNIQATAANFGEVCTGL